MNIRMVFKKYLSFNTIRKLSLSRIKMATINNMTSTLNSLTTLQMEKFHSYILNEIWNFAFVITSFERSWINQKHIFNYAKNKVSTSRVLSTLEFVFRPTASNYGIYIMASLCGPTTLCFMFVLWNVRSPTQYFQYKE